MAFTRTSRGDLSFGNCLTASWLSALTAGRLFAGIGTAGNRWRVRGARDRGHGPCNEKAGRRDYSSRQVLVRRYERGAEKESRQSRGTYEV